MILLDKSKRAESQWAARWVTYIETAVEPTFQAEFVESIDIPHATNPFPHLESLIGEAKSKWSADRLQSAANAQGGRRNQRASREERAARRERRARRD